MSRADGIRSHHQRLRDGLAEVVEGDQSKRITELTRLLERWLEGGDSTVETDTKTILGRSWRWRRKNRG